MFLSEILDRPIAFHRAFVRLGVGISGALMLSQAIYWSRRTNEPDGWFFKTQADWEEETGLSRFEQEGARQKLRATGVLEELRRGVPARMFYRVDFDALERLMVVEDLSHSRLRKTSKLDCGKPANKSAGFPQSLKEETTSKTTTEIRNRGRATRIPDDLVLDVAWAVDQGMAAADASREAERFRDYWTAAPGQRGVKRDWAATWRNWVRNALDRTPQPRRALPAPRREPDGLFALCAAELSPTNAGGGNVIEHE